MPAGRRERAATHIAKWPPAEAPERVPERERPHLGEVVREVLLERHPLADRQPVVRQLLRVQPYAHRVLPAEDVHLADARHGGFSTAAEVSTISGRGMGLDIVREVGVDRIRRKSVAMTTHLLELVDRHGFASVASRDPERLAGTVAVDVPDAKLVSRALKARDFVVDYRPGVGIRISPHFYNTFDELDRVMDEIVRIVRTKDYDRRESTSVVT